MAILKRGFVKIKKRQYRTVWKKYAGFELVLGNPKNGDIEKGFCEKKKQGIQDCLKKVCRIRTCRLKINVKTQKKSYCGDLEKSTWRGQRTSRSFFRNRVFRYGTEECVYKIWSLCLQTTDIYLYSYKGYQMWNAEDDSNRMGWKCASIFFSSFWPHIIHSAVGLSILICRTMHFYEIFSMSPQIGSIQL